MGLSNGVPRATPPVRCRLGWNRAGAWDVTQYDLESPELARETWKFGPDP